MEYLDSLQSKRLLQDLSKLYPRPIQNLPKLYSRSTQALFKTYPRPIQDLSSSIQDLSKTYPNSIQALIQALLNKTLSHTPPARTNGVVAASVLTAHSYWCRCSNPANPPPTSPHLCPRRKKVEIKHRFSRKRQANKINRSSRTK